MKVPKHTITIGSIIFVIMVLFAGCAAENTDERQTSTMETTAANNSTLVTTKAETTKTAEPTSTTGQQTTTSTDVNKNLPYELWVANYGNKTADVQVLIKSENKSTIYNKTLSVSGNTSKKINLTFQETGTYEIVATTSSTKKTRLWDIDRTDPSEAASVVLAGDGDLHIDLKVI